MKNSIFKTFLTCCICVLFIFAVNAQRHHRGGSSKDLYRAAAIVNIITNSLVGLSILSGNTPVVVPATPVYTAPAPVVVPATPVYTAPYPAYTRPVYITPAPRIYRRPPPPPPRHHRRHHGGHHGKRR